jgi:hypothetical protein
VTPDELRQEAKGLQQHIWRSVGTRKWFVGREGVCRITMLAVQRWPAFGASSPDQQSQLRDYIATQMRDYRGNDRKYGSIWVILLSAVISQALQALLKWWMDRKENQRVMEYMRTYRGKDGQQCL